MPYSLNEAGFVALNGAAQWIALRGEDAANPVLLMLSGPGVAFSGFADLFAPLEQRFTLAHWDQPGAGRTADRHGSQDPLSLERLIADGLALAEHVRRQLPGAPLIPLGVSGGSVVGLGMLARRPDLFAGYVGQGQIFDWPRQQGASYALTLQRLHLAGEPAGDLEALGPPPWPDVAADAVWSRFAGGFTPSELTALTALPPQPADTLARATAAFSRLRGGIAAFRAPTRFERPVLFLQGEADLYTPTSVLQDWLEGVAAPSKRLAIVPGTGHGAIFVPKSLVPEITPIFGYGDCPEM